MKIIKQGNSKPKEAKKTCKKCKTVFIYTNEDIQHDCRDGNYVICPNTSCKTFISAEHIY